MPTAIIQTTQLNSRAQISYYSGTSAGTSVLGSFSIHINNSQGRDYMIRISLDSVPANVNILKANIMLFNSPSGTTTDGVHSVSCFELTSNFGNISSLSQYPTYDPNPLDTHMLPQTSWMIFDVTETIKAIVKGEKPNYGFIFRVTPLSGTPQNYFFYTFNNLMPSSDPYYNTWTEGMTPKLEVTYADTLKSPSNLNPANNKNMLNSGDITFSWNHNGYEITSTQSKYELMYSTNGGGTWTTVSEVTGNQHRAFPAGTFSNGMVQWKVKTWDSNNISSVYSTVAQFTLVSVPAAPVITAPSGTITTGMPTITWTSTNQAGYRVEVVDSNGVLCWSKEDVLSTVKSIPMDTYLPTGQTYTIKVKYLGNNGFWSDFASSSITTNLEIPTPILVELVNKDCVKGGVTFSVTKDSTVSFYEVWRSEGDTFQRIATGLSDTSFSDYTQASGLEYKYKFRAYSVQGGYVETSLITSKVDFKGTVISDLDGNYIKLKYRSKRSEDYSLDATFQKYAGRVNSVVEFTISEDTGLSLQFDCREYSEIEDLKALIRKRKTLLLRDKLGAKMYGIIKNLSENYDVKTKIWNYSFIFYRIDYSEVV